ncbi:MAG: arginine biosynthesis bifunctional protein ArgJ [Deltaproteobacteria bacterium]|mgnify:CR=1 FL=1|jgi:glutamate N-acetyltransferase/amino-acid N-acetyltransferase|nr:MAG: arginine biosynthesis bifunctional protein ArgJ [Deltaproteobacteria bacterium]
MTRVPGFLASAIASGIKKNEKKDLALIFSKTPASAAGLFTTNVVKAAPVLVGMERVKSGLCQAIVVNSGNANACTGKRGIRDAKYITQLVARELGIKESLVIPSSTGLIGVPLPVEKIRKAIPKLVSSLSEDGFKDTADAIMTTDQFPKYAYTNVKAGSRNGTILAIGKGAGMIAPQMATMLCFILTDLNIDIKAQKKALKNAVNNSFNRIIVDGDTSTNDTVIMLSNGSLENKEIHYGDTNYKKLEKALTELTTEIAEMIVKDGEGATKVVRINVRGAKSEKEAEKIARTLGSSLLVKTAFYGEDANWGRVLAAAGRSGVKFDPLKVDLYFENYRIVRNGIEVMDEKEVNHVLKQPRFSITLDLKMGKGSFFVIASDITMDYLKLNAHYRT